MWIWCCNGTGLYIGGFDVVMEQVYILGDLML